MKPGVSNAKKKAVLLDQKIQISSIVVRYSNINDLWDWMSEANKVLKCKNQSLHESRIDGGRIIFMEKISSIGREEDNIGFLECWMNMAAKIFCMMD